jgi:predicted RND superfamily exporter protein
MDTGRRSLRAAELLWDYRHFLSLTALVITAVAVSQLASLGVSNSLEMWYPQDDPMLRQYQQFQRQFGSDEIVVVAVTSPDGFDSREGVELVADLTDSLYYVDGVDNVTSISTVPDSMRRAYERLLSDDGQTTALLLQMSGGPELESRRHTILVDIAAAADDFHIPARFAGYGVIFDGLNEASTRGSAALLVVAHLTMVVLLIGLFRRIGPVLVTVLAVLLATIWTMGLYSALDREINMVTMALPTLVLVIGIADCVHLLRSVAAQPAGQSRRTRVTRGLAAVLGPCTITSLTTAFGFLALSFSDLPVVRSLGWFGAVGMIFAYLTAVVVVTACLSLPGVQPHADNPLLSRFAVGLGGLGRRFPGIVITGFVAVAALSVAGMLRLQTDTFSIGYLPDTHEVRLDSDFIEQRIGAYAPLDFVVTGDDVLDIEVLDALQAWQKSIEEMETVDWSWSLLDALGIDSDTELAALPDNEITARISRLRLLSPAVADSMIADRTELRITFGAPVMSARSVQSLLKQIEQHADFPPHVSLYAAGYANLYTRIVERIVDSQVLGFATALVLILCAIGVATRSISRTLLAVPANLLPVVATLGLMGWIGIPLDVATATIATVILGLIVDDTVHILRPGAGTRTTILDAVHYSGASLVMTSIILCGGFAVLGLAGIRTIQWFGLLCSFAVATAITVDLLLLPALDRVLQIGTCKSGQCKSGHPSRPAPFRDTHQAPSHFSEVQIGTPIKRAISGHPSIHFGCKSGHPSRARRGCRVAPQIESK